MIPRMIFADEKGRIYDHPFLRMMGQEGSVLSEVGAEDLVPLPDGSKLFTLPGCLPVGRDPGTGKPVVLDEIRWSGRAQKIQAVSAFMPPGFTRAYLPAAHRTEKAPVLPLWAYAAAGWHDGRFWVTGIRVDQETRWDADRYDDRALVPLVAKKIKKLPKNRLLRHLKRCATQYHCLAAKNLFFGRWECPIPISPVCNADCLGCLSLQPEERFHASHERLNFVPSPEEVLEIAVPHLETAPDAVVSFGQGCDGEPLLQAGIIATIIKAIRRETSKGVIHINSNGYSPGRVAMLCDAGLDSLRVSLNSARKECYERYCNPRKFGFEDVLKSLKTASSRGIFCSINYLTFPGLTDCAEEMAAFADLVKESRPTMIQWKNMNIDPFRYTELMKVEAKEVFGMRRAIENIRKKFPALHFGYFNRPRRIMEECLKKPA